MTSTTKDVSQVRLLTLAHGQFVYPQSLLIEVRTELVGAVGDVLKNPETRDRDLSTYTYPMRSLGSQGYTTRKAGFCR